MSSICSISTERASDQEVDFSDITYERDSESDYDPSQGEESAQTNASLPSHVRIELETVDRHPLCCMLTMEPKESAAIEIAHIVPRATPRTNLRILKEVWNTQKRVSVNDVKNLVYLRVDLHKAFDLGYWALFPQMDLLDSILKAEAHNAFQRNLAGPPPKLKSLFHRYSSWKGQKTFNYRVAWMHTVPSGPILRKNGSSNSATNGSTAGVLFANALEVQCSSTTVKDAAENLWKMVRDLPSPLGEASVDDKAFERQCDALVQALDHFRKSRTENTSSTARSNKTVWEREAGFLRDASVAMTAINDNFCLDAMQAIPDATPLISSGDNSADTPSKSILDKLRAILESYDAYIHPFPDFPIIHSHAHPLFVIENTGQKIHTLSMEALQMLGPEATRIDYIYRSWHDLPLRKKSRPARNKQDSDVGDGDQASERTSQHDDEGHNPTASQNSEGSNRPAGRSTRGKVVKRPYDACDAVCLDSSAGTPSLAHDGPGSSNQDNDSLPDADMEANVTVHHYKSLPEWASDCTVDSSIELTNDHQLGADDEAARPPRPDQWKLWAKSPPKMPQLIMDHEDTSKLTSYDWSLYHERVNLLAPYGSHEVSNSHFIPWVPRVYDP